MPLGYYYFEFIFGSFFTEVIFGNLFPILNSIIVEVSFGDLDFILNYVPKSLVRSEAITTADPNEMCATYIAAVVSFPSSTLTSAVN